MAVADGFFFVEQLPDGRFVAASSRGPHFCFRGETEEAVLAKLRRSLSFYTQANGGDGTVRIKTVTRTLTTLQPRKRVALTEVLEAA